MDHPPRRFDIKLRHHYSSRASPSDRSTRYEAVAVTFPAISVESPGSKGCRRFEWSKPVHVPVPSANGQPGRVIDRGHRLELHFPQFPSSRRPGDGKSRRTHRRRLWISRVRRPTLKRKEWKLEILV